MTSLSDIQRHVGVTPDGVLGPATLAAIAKALGIVAKPRALAHPGIFFTAVRAITKGLDQTQVDTINRLLVSAAEWRTSWLAYALATAWHECRLRPIHEEGGPAYLARYEGRAELENTHKGDGVKYAGRGLVQLTGRRNYRRAGEYLGLDLLEVPDQALEPAVAARILVWGMEGGEFTGKSLGDYLTGELATFMEYKNARRIINGTDKDELIAGYALDFQKALLAGGWA